MVDTVTTKGIAVSATTVARQGYWRGVFRRLLRHPGRLIDAANIHVQYTLAHNALAYRQRPVPNVDVFTPQADRYRRLPAGLR